MLVIKNGPFLVPVKDPVLLISIVCLMIGSIVKRKSLGNGGEEQAGGELSITPPSLFVSTGSLHPHFKKANEAIPRCALYSTSSFAKNPLRGARSVQWLTCRCLSGSLMSAKRSPSGGSDAGYSCNVIMLIRLDMGHFQGGRRCTFVILLSFLISSEGTFW